EVRTVEVTADDARAAGHIAVQLAAEREERVVLRAGGDGTCGREARCPVPGVAPAYRAEGFRRAVHEVGPVATVDVQIDESRREVHPAEVDRAGRPLDILLLTGVRDAAVFGHQRGVR